MKKFHRSKLKTGMNIYFEDGTYGTVLLNTNNGDIVAGETWFPINTFCEYIDEWSRSIHGLIKKITQPISNFDYLRTSNEKVIWERIDEKTFVINGKEYSESTIHKALREYVK